MTLINGFAAAAGQSFDVLDFDPARDTISFSTVTLPALVVRRQMRLRIEIAP